jgi:hypothetical protein
MQLNRIVLENFIRIKKLINEYQLDINLAELVIFGSQTSGKTSLIGGFVGFDVGFRSIGTATKGPVRYILINDDKYFDYYIEFKSVNHEAKGITKDKLIDLMTIEMSNDFFTEPVIVEIHNRFIPTITFIDLPGFLTEKSEIANRILTINIPFLQKKDYYFLCLCRSTDSWSTNSDRSVIENIFKENNIIIDERKFIYVINKIDKHLNDLGKEDEYNSFFKDEKNRKNLFFTTLCPYNSEKQLPFSLVLSNFQVYENKYFEKNMKMRLDTIDKNRIGFINLKQHVINLWLLNFYNNLDDLINILETKKDNLNQQIINLKIQVELSDYKKIKQLYFEYSMDFLTQMYGLQNGCNVIDIKSKSQTNYNYIGKHHYNSDKFGKTYKEELNYSYEIYWDFLIIHDDLIKIHLKEDQKLFIDLSKKLIGISSFYRLKDIFEYFLISRTMREYSNDNIDNMSFNKDTSNQFATFKTITQMVSNQINNANFGIHWFLTIIERMIDSHIEIVNNHLLTSDKYQLIVGHFNIITEINKKYKQSINNKLQKIYSRWTETVLLYSDNIPIDITTKTIFSLIINPLESIIDNKDFFDVVSDKKEENIIQKIKKQGIYLTLNEKYLNYQIKDRPKCKLDLILEIRKYLKQQQGQINIADYIESGFQEYKPIERSMINYDFLRCIAQEYYIVVMNKFILDFDQAINYYLFNYINDTQRVEMPNIFNDYIISLDDKVIAENIKIDLDDVKKTLQKKEEENKLVIDTWKSLLLLQKQIKNNNDFLEINKEIIYNKRTIKSEEDIKRDIKTNLINKIERDEEEIPINKNNNFVNDNKTEINNEIEKEI